MFQSKKLQYTLLQQIHGERARYLALDKDTGKYFDIRNQQEVSVLQANLINPSKSCKSSESHWKQFWQEYDEHHQKLVWLIQQDEYLEFVQLFERKGKIQTQVNYRSLDNWTFLHFAANIGSLKICKYLINKKIDLSIKSRRGRTPLHYAADSGYQEIIDLFVSAGSDIDSVDLDGNTALHLACISIRPLSINKLLQKGAKRTKNKQGLLPEQCSNLKQVIQIFDRGNQGIVKHSAYSVFKQNYKFIQVLGQGAFGKVFLAKNLQTGQLSAIKALNKQLIAKKKMHKFVKTQKNAMKTMNHPFIVGLKFSFQNPRFLFLGIEFCQGRDLEKLLNNIGMKMQQSKVKIYAAQLILVLQALHNANIVYRDIKPENIMLDKEGHVKLSDFGLSKDNFSEKEISNDFVGTPAFIPPEILSKKGHNRMADWYSFGIVLTQMLTGQPLYFAQDRDKLFRNILFMKPKLPDSISQSGRNFIMGLIQRNPKLRLGNKVQQLKKHQWLKDINWQDILQKKGQVIKPIKFIEPKGQLFPNFGDDGVQNKIQEWTYVKKQ